MLSHFLFFLIFFNTKLSPISLTVSAFPTIFVVSFMSFSVKKKEKKRKEKKRKEKKRREKKRRKEKKRKINNEKNPSAFPHQRFLFTRNRMHQISFFIKSFHFVFSLIFFPNSAISLSLLVCCFSDKHIPLSFAYLIIENQTPPSFFSLPQDYPNSFI